MHIQMAGIKTEKDAIDCVKAGVDIIGLLVGQNHTSTDFVSKEKALAIKNCLPKSVKTTLITHLENAGDIIEIERFIGVDYIQLHSYILESEVEKIHNVLPYVKLLRLVHINDGKVLNDISKFKFVDFYFTDSINTKTNQFGGTGLLHDWQVDKKLVETLDKPVFIAGGLTPNNVAKAIRFCKPFGVDVNSGCKGDDGFRDMKKVAQFVKNANKA